MKSINLFYASIVGKDEESSSLSKAGFKPISQVKIVDPYGDEKTEAKPDFCLFKDDYMAMIEIKSGTNVNEGDIQQLIRNGEFTIEGVRRSFRRTENISLEVSEIESFIVYYKSTIDDCIEIPNCKESFDGIIENGILLTQEENGLLKLHEDSNEPKDETLKTILSTGIDLPKEPKTEFEILDNPFCENVMVFLIRKFINEFKTTNEILMDQFDMRKKFIPPGIACQVYKVKNALECFRKLDCATKERGGDRYRIKKDDLGKLVKVPEFLLNNNCEDVLDEKDREEKISLEDFQ